MAEICTEMETKIDYLITTLYYKPLMVYYIYWAFDGNRVDVAFVVCSPHHTAVRSKHKACH